jgi:hypothetical protein
MFNIYPTKKSNLHILIQIFQQSMTTEENDYELMKIPSEEPTISRTEEQPDIRYTLLISKHKLSPIE